ncbi:MAG: radical SAM protein [Betaproteobacteria bacterium]|nr:radical SAM protein [Betaproteobacteria bacterium]MBI3938986.1 radical SAM protein [Betaproteobacteria bacterium]
MAIGLASWFGKRERERPFEAFQIEVTSRCNLRCVMCPVTVLADRWPSVDLSWESFQRIAGAFDKTQWVYLQGWGEPLLHRRLFDMIALAKRAGCRVGFTTNGTRLTRSANERLLEAGLDVLAVSIAGANAGTHEAIRAGSDFHKLLDNLHRFLALRASRKSATPRLELLFLMTKTNLAELPDVVKLAAELGADELVATNLDYAITPSLDEMKAYSLSPQARAAREIVDQAKHAARQAGLAFRPYSPQPREVAVCDLNPLKILFISADGWVSPCVYLGVTGQQEIPRVFDGKAASIPLVRFGNVNDQSLVEIWEAPAYRAFRRQFSERLLGVVKMAVGGVSRSAASAPLPPAPEACRTCPKLYGL